MKRKRLQLDRVPWTPFVRAQHDPDMPMMARGDAVFLNSRYQVTVTFGTVENMGRCAELSIRTLDRQARHDWRDLQRIKNELCGPESEGVELYPRESRLVDTANQYYLYVFEAFRFPFGFPARLVAEGDVGKSRQRPFDLDQRPTDCLTPLEWQAKLAHALPFLSGQMKGTAHVQAQAIRSAASPGGGGDLAESEGRPVVLPHEGEEPSGGGCERGLHPQDVGGPSGASVAPENPDCPAGEVKEGA